MQHQFPLRPCAGVVTGGLERRCLTHRKATAQSGEAKAVARGHCTTTHTLTDSLQLRAMCALGTQAQSLFCRSSSAMLVLLPHVVTQLKDNLAHASVQGQATLVSVDLGSTRTPGSPRLPVSKATWLAQRSQIEGLRQSRVD